MTRRAWKLVALLVIVLLGVAIATPSPDAFTGSGDGVAIIPLYGPIYSADEAAGWIDEALQSERVKAVVLRVDSPGGAVGASQEIFHALQRLAKEKPLVASFGNVAASGGYYAGVAAEHIFAMPGTITASIGVRMSTLDASRLLEYVMLKPGVLKSGALKDAGAPHRAMTPEEQAYLERVLVDMHAQFKGHVATARKLDEVAIDAAADGRVMTGREALELGLIDELGDLYDAISHAGTLSGLGEDPEVLELPEPGFFESLTAENLVARWFARLSTAAPLQYLVDY